MSNPTDTPRVTAIIDTHIQFTSTSAVVARKATRNMAPVTPMVDSTDEMMERRIGLSLEAESGFPSLWSSTAGTWSTPIIGIAR